MARTILVLGGGACGMFFCLFAKLFGAAKNVVLVDIMDERLQQALSLGLADKVLNPQRDEQECWSLVDETHGAYADVLFDALPGRLPAEAPPTRRIGMQLLRPKGEYIMYAAAKDTDMPAIEWLAKGPRFRVAPYDSRVIDFTQRSALMKRILGFIQRNLIRPEDFIARQIDFRSPLDVQELFRQYGRTPELKVEILA